jgi:hypothetical protein
MKMSTQGHTPGPWIAELIGVSDAGPNGIDVFDIGPANSAGEMQKRITTIAGDDAAFIVGACNSHADLLAALEEFRRVDAVQRLCDALLLCTDSAVSGVLERLASDLSMFADQSSAALAKARP